MLHLPDLCRDLNLPPPLQREARGAKDLPTRSGGKWRWPSYAETHANACASSLHCALSCRRSSPLMRLTRRSAARQPTSGSSTTMPSTCALSLLDSAAVASSPSQHVRTPVCASPPSPHWRNQTHLCVLHAPVTPPPVSRRRAPCTTRCSPPSSRGTSAASTSSTASSSGKGTRWGSRRAARRRASVSPRPSGCGASTARGTASRIWVRCAGGLPALLRRALAGFVTSARRLRRPRRVCLSQTRRAHRALRQGRNGPGPPLAPLGRARRRRRRAPPLGRWHRRRRPRPGRSGRRRVPGAPAGGGVAPAGAARRAGLGSVRCVSIVPHLCMSRR